MFGRSKERELFASGEGGKKPQGYVAVALSTDGRVRFHYRDARKGGVCSFGIEATLKPDGRYRLHGGPAYIDGIPLITGGSGCSLGVVDEESGLPVEAKKLTVADYCTRTK